MFDTRPMEEGDKPFIYNSFLESYRESYPTNRVPKTIYFRNQRAVIDVLLELGECWVLVFPEDPTEKVGYIIFQVVSSEVLAVHWMYICHDYRRKHYAAGLMAKVRGSRQLIVATHITDKFSILKHKVPGCRVVFDPYFVTNERIGHARAA